MVKYLFEEVGANRVAARHAVENAKSGRVMQKIGMAMEGVLRQSDSQQPGHGGPGAVFAYLHRNINKKDLDDVTVFSYNEVVGARLWLKVDASRRRNDPRKPGKFR